MAYPPSVTEGTPHRSRGRRGCLDDTQELPKAVPDNATAYSGGARGLGGFDKPATQRYRTHLGLSDLEYRQVVQLKGLRSRQQELATQKTA
jgi:hypothetical protein